MKNKLIVFVSLANTNSTADPMSACAVTVYKSVDGAIAPVKKFYGKAEHTNKTAVAYGVLNQFADWLVDNPGVPVQFVCTDKNTNTSLMKFVKMYMLLAPTWIITKRFLDGANNNTDEYAERYVRHIQKFFTAGYKAAPEVLEGQVQMMDRMLSAIVSSDHPGVWTMSLKELKTAEENRNLWSIASNETSQLIKIAGWSDCIKGKTFKTAGNKG